MSQIVVSGITSYPTRDHRFEACYRFLRGAKAIGVPVYLADTSPADIQAEFEALGAILVLCSDTSYTGKKIASLQAAVNGGAASILITEMEKDGLLPYLERLCQPILDGSADLVIPERTEVSWTSYPKEFAIERFALDQIRQFTGRYFDTMMGAFVIHRDLAPRFLNCREEMWTWLHAPPFGNHPG